VIKMGKFPRKVTGYLCPECEEFYEDEDEAEECCPREVEKTERWQCVTCDDIYEDKDDAYNCCG